MSDTKKTSLTPLTHPHPTGTRCCGRPLEEKCSPEEEAGKLDPKTGKKCCCKGKHH